MFNSVAHQVLDPKFVITIFIDIYRQTSNISCTLVANKLVDHSDVVGASPAGAAPTQ